MSSVTCKACGKGFENGESACPHCGTKIAGGFAKKILVAFFGLALFSVLVASAENQKGTSPSSVASSQPVEKTSATDDSGVNWQLTQELVSQHFLPNGKSTQLQASKAAQELIGQRINWVAPVREIAMNGPGYLLVLEPETRMGANFKILSSIAAVVQTSDTSNSEFVESVGSKTRIGVIGTIESIEKGLVKISQAQVFSLEQLEKIMQDYEMANFNSQSAAFEITTDEFSNIYLKPEEALKKLKGKKVTVIVKKMKSAGSSANYKRIEGISKDDSKKIITFSLPVSHFSSWEEIEDKTAEVTGIVEDCYADFNNASLKLCPALITKIINQ